MSPSLFQTLLRSGPQRVRGHVSARLEPHLRAKPWLERALKRLPPSVVSALREALGVEAQLVELRLNLAELQREKRALGDRLAALDVARADLDKALMALREAQLNHRAREAGLDARAATLDAYAQRLAREAEAQERLVPTRDILNALPPRPRAALGMAALVAHMRRFGQLTPLVVRAREDGRFDLLSGRRRLEALKRNHATHARVRVVDLSDEAAAALYLAENYLTLGVSPQALKRDADHLQGAAGLDPDALNLTLEQQAEAVDTLPLEALVEEARYHLAEGASWLLSLHKHWTTLSPEERARLEGLVAYLTRLNAYLKSQHCA
ncbi:ParB/RepB/Spo0J family partition protein [Myxococcota bacterium]|nr:ParB/RepB/Spo0J family partition protein [Myxococcota bacterium]MBU1429539.1 ParB/RepB/Spo0J family partition protein [Myxococcota bacterium]MBU1898914.1 ParB/RepB/Spo0J family partition protein [Myxococcota bacterium]